MCHRLLAVIANIVWYICPITNRLLPYYPSHRLIRYLLYCLLVIIMCAAKDTVRRIMITAYRMGMVQTGEYVFINVELTTG